MHFQVVGVPVVDGPAQSKAPASGSFIAHGGAAQILHLSFWQAQDARDRRDRFCRGRGAFELERLMDRRATQAGLLR